MKERPDRGQALDMEKERSVPKGISHRTLTIARLIDRHCRAPGEYIVKLVIPHHGRAKWRVEVIRQERIRSMEIDRKGNKA